ncbi:MAG: chlorinating enzyme [Cyclobacteriaceae bacterium]
MNNILTDTELEQFYKNGFIGPFKLYEVEEAKEILKSIRIKSLDRKNILYDNPVNYDRHFDIQELSDHVCHPGIVNRLKPILGDDVLCWRTEWFPKFPGAKGTEWHQVGDYSYATGDPMLVPTEDLTGKPMDMTVWTCFTPATKENGCMKFLPGSQNQMYFDESKTKEKSKHLIDYEYEYDLYNDSFYGYNFADFKIDKNWEPDESKAVHIEMKPGECIIFSAKCVHASNGNTTKNQTRLAITARYVQNHVKVYENTDQFRAHGADFDLKKYGCVQVSGNDSYGHNKIRKTNNLGVDFQVR